MQASFEIALRTRCPGIALACNVPMASYSTMRVGGAARWLCAPQNEDEIIFALRCAREAGIDVFVLGNGSNVVFSDSGFSGLVLYLGQSLCGYAFEGSCLRAQAGALLPVLAHAAMERGLSGLEFLSGIPASLGGAVCMNAGAYGGEIKDVLLHARVLTGGEIQTLTRDDLRLSYRHSLLHEIDGVLLSAEIRLTPEDPKRIHDRMAELAAMRRQKQPLGLPSCGSFFKRPEGHYAAALIDEAGLKGFSVGGAQVSPLHAGFVVNTGNATAKDIIRLMRHVQAVVWDRFGVSLQPEVLFAGDFEA